MKNRSTRGLLASAAALLTTMALAVGGTAAQATTVPNPPSEVTVTVTKLEQPGTLGDPASGLQQDPAPTERPVPGVTFTYTKVPGTGEGEAQDSGTIDGQNYASTLTVAAARTAIDGAPATTLGTTAADGTISATLPRGGYLVEEDIATLPPGVTAADPFLMTLPMTNPDTRDGWLSHVYIYPKSAVMTATKSVANKDVLVTGKPVTWTITADIPKVANPNSTGSADQFLAPDQFKIVDNLNYAHLDLVNGTVAVSTGATGGASTPLTIDQHYSAATTTPVGEPGTTRLTVEFTEAGRAALASAVNADSDATVILTFDTTVKAATTIVNTAYLYPNKSAVNDKRPLTSNTGEIRYGIVTVRLLSGEAGLKGGEFRVYTSEDAAKNRLEAGRITLGTTEQWTTGADGTFTLKGLRLSSWSDGASVTKGSDGYQTYWLVQTTAPMGHQLLAEPVELDFTEDGQILTINQAPSTGALVLPLTGGQGTALFTVAGLAILGFVVIAARRRTDHAVA
ncbi:SpaH/EbpB family LPXTG-anchored major pilin [Flaviflexus huanghaiensis]|uniref:SpaH/EbpB family LPXTG-anchored major pilin n=1 Tax=Flaviflexus huanghaiensis TaxID=1111473 RepID=UPI0015F88FA6|nr:SpaH/EbpB family LPXTG-anchored major pilin [Flaviflexus huanghaiensis]